jgi:hypothetical protein
MAFDDGTPLDAAALQDLDRRLVEIKASIPKIGDDTPGSNPSLENKTITAKQIVGGMHTGVALTPGKATPFTIKFTGVESKPKSVILTPIRTADIPSVFSFAVDASSLDAGGVKGNAYLNSSAKKGFTIGFYWMVICH